MVVSDSLIVESMGVGMKRSEEVRSKIPNGIASRIKTVDHRCACQQGVIQPISHKTHNIKKSYADDINTRNTEAYAVNDTQHACI